MRIAYDRNLVGIGSPLIRPYTMRIFLAGVSCVGKTTIGAKLADRLGCRFFDLDAEIEGFFGTPIEHLIPIPEPIESHFSKVWARAI
jgi:shikimate kinase